MFSHKFNCVFIAFKWRQVIIFRIYNFLLFHWTEHLWIRVDKSLEIVSAYYWWHHNHDHFIYREEQFDSGEKISLSKILAIFMLWSRVWWQIFFQPFHSTLNERKRGKKKLQTHMAMMCASKKVSHFLKGIWHKQLEWTNVSEFFCCRMNNLVVNECWMLHSITKYHSLTFLLLPYCSSILKHEKRARIPRKGSDFFIFRYRLCEDCIFLSQWQQEKLGKKKTKKLLARSLLGFIIGVDCSQWTLCMYWICSQHIPFSHPKKQNAR